MSLTAAYYFTQLPLTAKQFAMTVRGFWVDLYAPWVRGTREFERFYAAHVQGLALRRGPVPNQVAWQGYCPLCGDHSFWAMPKMGTWMCFGRCAVVGVYPPKSLLHMLKLEGAAPEVPAMLPGFRDEMEHRHAELAGLPRSAAPPALGRSGHG